VHLVHRRDELRATMCIAERCFINEKIVMQWSKVIDEIVGQDGKVAGVRLRSIETGAEEILPVDGVFIFVGIDAKSALVAGLCDLDEAGFVLVDRNGQTSLPGLYAAGDVTDDELKQVITASARGAFAAYHALHYVDHKMCEVPQPQP
jgi:thioredoxin reductase (NADPH)